VSRTTARVSGSVRLRRWQHAALDRFLTNSEPDFLAVATPGAGKTTFALVAVRIVLVEQPAPVVVVTPTAHLKTQWAQAAARLQLHLDPAWSAADGALPSDMHGVVTTYQQVALNPAAVRRIAVGAFVILDEVHHGGEDRAWGAALQEAFGVAGRRLSLSGTPFRSDTRAIPFVRYQADEAIPDFEYGYDDALHLLGRLGGCHLSSSSEPACVAEGSSALRRPARRSLANRVPRRRQAAPECGVRPIAAVVCEDRCARALTTRSENSGACSAWASWLSRNSRTRGTNSSRYWKMPPCPASL
jgi:hypothetical protein